MVVKITNTLPKNIDIIIYLTCKINKNSIEKALDIKLPKTLFNNFTGDYNDIKKQYFNDKIVLIGGLGKVHKCTNENIRKMIANCINSVSYEGKNICFFLMKSEDHLKIDAEVVSALLTLYNFDKYKTSDKPNQPKNVYFYSKSKKYNDQVKKSIIIGNSVNKVRDLINEPGNKLNPDTYVKYLKKMGTQNKFTVEIINHNKLKKLGMGGIEAVCQGSKYKPRLAVIKYLKDKNKKNIVLVGKGVTFDAGGINIKYNDFSDMKSDMTGSAIVFGVIDCIAKLGLKRNIIGLLPIVENMPDANAIRPGDIIKSYNKKTIEVIDTDAEGRLIMADALAYAKKYNPSLIIDIATLTGQAESITNHKASIIMGNDKNVINKLTSIGEQQGEKLINLSIWRDFVEQTKSNIANYKNFNNDQGGTIYAGAFLSNFVPTGVKWVHIDLGGDILFGDEYYYKKGATGKGTRLLINYIINE